MPRSPAVEAAGSEAENHESETRRANGCAGWVYCREDGTYPFSSGCEWHRDTTRKSGVSIRDHAVMVKAAPNAATLARPKERHSPAWRDAKGPEEPLCLATLRTKEIEYPLAHG